MAFNDAMMYDTVWFDRPKYEEEVANYQKFLSGHAVAAVTASTAAASDSGSTLVNQIKQARSHIKQSLSQVEVKVEPKVEAPAAAPAQKQQKGSEIQALEKENQDLKKLVADLTSRLSALEVRVGKVETCQATPAPAPAAAPAPVVAPVSAPAPKAAAKKPAADESDSDDPFGGSDDD